MTAISRTRRVYVEQSVGYGPSMGSSLLNKPCFPHRLAIKSLRLQRLAPDVCYDIRALPGGEVVEDYSDFPNVPLTRLATLEAASPIAFAACFDASTVASATFLPASPTVVAVRDAASTTAPAATADAG